MRIITCIITNLLDKFCHAFFPKTNTGKAIEMLAHALHTGTTPQERTFTVAKSFPTIEELAKRPMKKSKRAGI